MPQIAELQPKPILPAEFSYQIPQAERTIMNIDVLPFVEVGDIDLACEQVGLAKGLQSFSPDEFPAEAQAMYVPYQGNPGEDSCEFKLADFLVQDIDPQAKAEAIVTNIGKVVVEPSAPNIIHFTAPDGGVHEVVSQKPGILLNWLASKGYSHPEPNEQTFTVRFEEPKPPVEAKPPMNDTEVAALQTQVLPLPNVKTDVFEFRPRVKIPKRPTAKMELGGQLGNQIIDLPAGDSGQEGSVVISEAPEIAPAPTPKRQDAKQDLESALPPSEQYLTIRRVMGMVGANTLVKRHGLKAEAVERAMTDVMNNGRLDQAFPDTHVPRDEIWVTSFNERTSLVIRTALKEIVRTAPNMERIQAELRLKPAADVADVSPHLNTANVLYHIDIAKQAALVLKKPTLMSPETFSEKVVSAGRRGLSALRNVFRRK